MDWLSIATGCFAASTAIAKTSLAVRVFVRQVRESRRELEPVSSELHSLDDVLDLMKDDASSFPAELASQMPAILRRCVETVQEVESCLGNFTPVLDDPSGAEPRAQWPERRKRVADLGVSLEGYRLALGLVLDLVALTTPQRDGKDVTHVNEVEATEDIRKVLSNLLLLKTQLRNEAQRDDSVQCLQSYLESLQVYMESIYPDIDLFDLGLHRASLCSSSQNGPDSAIGLNEEPSSFPWKESDPAREVSHPLDELVFEDIDELLNEAHELDDVPSRPPTPPPKSLARRRFSYQSPPVSTSEDLPAPEQQPRSASQELPRACTPILPIPEAAPPANKEPFIFVTKLGSVSDLALPTTKKPTTAGNTKTSTLGRLFGPSKPVPASSSVKKTPSATPARPATPIERTGSIGVPRRSSVRNSLRRLSFIWEADDITKDRNSGPEVMRTPVCRF